MLSRKRVECSGSTEQPHRRVAHSGASWGFDPGPVPRDLPRRPGTGGQARPLEDLLPRVPAPSVDLFGYQLDTATARKGRAVCDDFALPGVGDLLTTSPTSHSPQSRPRMNGRVSQDAL
jgi:hypothetical protein